MNNLKLKFLGSLCLLATLLLSGCADDDDTLAPFTVNFSSTELGISPSSQEAEVTLTFSRPATVAGSISLLVQPGTLTYGEDGDFYTSVAPDNNTITLPFAPGNQRVSFTIFAGSAANLQEQKTLTLLLTEDTGLVFSLGGSDKLEVLFDENFISPGGSLVINVTKEFSQRGYIDLSKATVAVEDVDNYDLGFQNGSGFYVTLNASATVMARPLDKNDLNQVTVADTVGFGAVMRVREPNFDPTTGSVAWIDTPDGNLETTAFKAIAANDDDNKVFIIKRDNGNWKKVRVLQGSNGYVLQHADIAATSFETLEITKNDTYEAVAVHLDNGVVNASPENDRWDLMYTKYTEILNLGPGAPIPYEFNDYIVSNRNDVSAAMVMVTDNLTYESFTSEDVQDVSFSGEINAIGSRWRQGGGPSSAPAVFKDRFFVVTDGQQNTYKVLFTDMYSDANERGEISFTYELLN